MLGGRIGIHAARTIRGSRAWADLVGCRGGMTVICLQRTPSHPSDGRATQAAET